MPATAANTREGSVAREHGRHERVGHRGQDRDHHAGDHDSSGADRQEQASVWGGQGVEIDQFDARRRSFSGVAGPHLVDAAVSTRLGLPSCERVLVGDARAFDTFEVKVNKEQEEIDDGTNERKAIGRQEHAADRQGEEREIRPRRAHSPERNHSVTTAHRPSAHHM